MKKLFPLLLTLTLLLGACNLPGGNNDNSAAENQNAVETLSALIVLQTLEAHTAEAETGGATEGDNADSGDDPVAAGTATPFPTISPTPTEAPPTALPSPTITLTPTEAAEDPAILLGDPDWKDEFDNETYWNPYSGGSFNSEIKDGKFYLTMVDTLDYDYWITSAPVIRDFYLEVEATTPDTCEAGDFFGIMFRAPDDKKYNKGYILSFNCAGQYRLTYWNGNSYDYIINWADSEAIIAGGNATNRIGIRAQGDQLDVYANGTKINGFIDTTSGTGLIGLSVGASDTKNFVVIFDNMRYWLLP